MSRTGTNRIAVFPFLEDLRQYSLAKFRLDLVAGLTVAIFAVPQAMAYALLAGVPAVHGLYAAMLMSIVAALWGASPHLNTGLTNTSALLTAAALAPFAGETYFLPLVFAFTVLTGIMRLGCGLLRMGRLVRFVPESAFLGFMVGAGTLIVLGQLHNLLNVEASHHPWFPMRMYEVLGHIREANGLAVAIGLGTFLFVLVLDRFSKRIPVALLAILLATGASVLAGADAGLRHVSPIPHGLPGFRMPLLNIPLMVELIPAALAVSLIGLIEAVSIGQVLALRRGQTLNFSQEFIGQGLSHIVGGFFQGLPGSGSFARSTLMEQSGGETRFGNVFFGVFTAMAVLLVPGFLNLIPVCALAGLLLYLGVKMIDFHRVRRVLDTSQPDTAVMLLTFFTTVFIKIEYGIFVGISAGALIFFNRASRLHLFELVPQPDGGFEERTLDLSRGKGYSDVLALSIAGELFYGVAHDLRDQLNKVADSLAPRHLIIRVRRAYSIDYSCWNALFDFAEQFAAKGGKLYLCGVRPDFEQIISGARMHEYLPPERIFPSEISLYRAVNACMDSILADLPAEAHLSTDWAACRGPERRRD